MRFPLSLSFSQRSHGSRKVAVSPYPVEMKEDRDTIMQQMPAQSRVARRCRVSVVNGRLLALVLFTLIVVLFACFHTLSQVRWSKGHGRAIFREKSGCTPLSTRDGQSPGSRRGSELKVLCASPCVPGLLLV